MNTALSLVREDDIQARAAAAQAELDALNSAAERAEIKAQAALEAFEAKPTRESAGDRDVAEQIAINARRKAQAFATEHASLFHEASTSAKRAELASLRAQLTPGEFESLRQRILDIVANVRRDLRGALTELGEQVRASNRIRHRAQRLAEQLGEPSNYQSVTLERILSEVIPLPPVGTGVPSTKLACFSPNGQESGRRFVLELNELLGGGQ